MKTPMITSAARKRPLRPRWLLGALLDICLFLTAHRVCRSPLGPRPGR
jgi:hypothetical protein